MVYEMNTIDKSAFWLGVARLSSGLNDGEEPSSWVATRRGLHKPVSSSPPFKTGLAAFTAPGLTPAILLRGQTAPRSVPSHFSSSTGVHPWTACAFAGYLCSSLFAG